MLATVVLAICAVVALSSWKKEFLFKEKIKIIKEIKVLSLSLYNKINKSRSPAPFLKHKLKIYNIHQRDLCV